MNNSIALSALMLHVVIAVSLFVPIPGYSRQSEIQPGSYVTEGGWGNLAIFEKDGVLNFAINSIGANAHTCELAGQIVNGEAVLELDDEKNTCVVKFRSSGSGIDVSEDEDRSCRNYFCGARAGFTGLYLRPDRGCEQDAVVKARNEFRQLYDKKSYSKAYARLRPVLDNCEEILFWADTGWIRNDLAITLHRLGNDRECLHILEPLEDDSKMTADELEESYPPADAEIAIPIAEAARTNLKLCGGTAKKKGLK